METHRELHGQDVCLYTSYLNKAAPETGDLAQRIKFKQSRRQTLKYCEQGTKRKRPVPTDEPEQPSASRKLHQLADVAMQAVDADLASADTSQQADTQLASTAQLQQQWQDLELAQTALQAEKQRLEAFSLQKEQERQKAWAAGVQWEARIRSQAAVQEQSNLAVKRQLELRERQIDLRERQVELREKQVDTRQRQMEELQAQLASEQAASSKASAGPSVDPAQIQEQASRIIGLEILLAYQKSINAKSCTCVCPRDLARQIVTDANKNMYTCHYVKSSQNRS